VRKIRGREGWGWAESWRRKEREGGVERRRWWEEGGRGECGWAEVKVGVGIGSPHAEPSRRRSTPHRQPVPGTPARPGPVGERRLCQRRNDYSAHPPVNSVTTRFRRRVSDWSCGQNVFAVVGGLRTLHLTVCRAQEKVHRVSFDLPPPSINAEDLRRATKEKLRRSGPTAGRAFDWSPSKEGQERDELDLATSV